MKLVPEPQMSSLRKALIVYTCIYNITVYVYLVQLLGQSVCTSIYMYMYLMMFNHPSCHPHRNAFVPAGIRCRYPPTSIPVILSLPLLSLDYPLDTNHPW